MARINYPEAAEHGHQHQIFIERLDALAEDYRTGAPIRGIDVIGLLGNWWQSHIKGSDGKVAQFAAARKSGNHQERRTYPGRRRDISGRATGPKCHHSGMQSLRFRIDCGQRIRKWPVSGARGGYSRSHQGLW